MITVMINHEVSDYKAWKKTFDEYEPIRTIAGFKLINIYSDINNPNKITILFNAPSIEAVHSVFDNPKLKKDMIDAGVIVKPEIQILNRI